MLVSKKDISNDIIKTLYKVVGISKELTKNSSVTLDELDLDSLELVETTMELEDIYGISLPDDFLADKFLTLDEICNSLDKILNKSNVVNLVPRIKSASTVN